MRGEELNGFVHLHFQDFAGALAAPGHIQRIAIEALAVAAIAQHLHVGQEAHFYGAHALAFAYRTASLACVEREACRSEEHTSELQSLMRISYAVFCLKKKTTAKIQTQQYTSYHI